MLTQTVQNRHILFVCKQTITTVTLTMRRLLRQIQHWMQVTVWGTQVHHTMRQSGCGVLNISAQNSSEASSSGKVAPPQVKISQQANQPGRPLPRGTVLWAIANTPAPPPVQHCARARCGRRVDYYRQCFICQRQICIQCSYQLPGVVSIGGYGLDSVCPPCVHWWNTRATQERKLQVLQTASVIQNVHRELGF